MNSNFLNMFSSEQFGKYQSRKSGNKTDIARTKVINLLERSKALFLDPGFTYVKNQTTQKPLACFSLESDGRYSVRIIYARATVPMPNGYDCIYCTKDRVPEIHDMLSEAVQLGLLDEQLQAVQKRITKPTTSKE